MRFLSVFALAICFSFSAQAQYTTKSSVSADEPSAEAGMAQKPQAVQSAQPAQPAARFRPRVVEENPEGDSDLPSFEAFEKPQPAAQGSAQPAVRRNPYAPQAQGSAAAGLQGSAQGSVRPIVEPKGEIWIYMSDFSWGDVNGSFVHCKWKGVLQNRTDTEIERLKISFTVRETYSELDFNGIKPRGASVVPMMTYTELCPAMQNVKPKIKVLSCRLGDIAGSDCSKYIVIK